MLKSWRASALVLSLSCSGLIAFFQIPHASAEPTSAQNAACYDIPQEQHSQTRETFLEMLKDPEMDSQSTDKLVEMLRSYRRDAVDGALTIAQSPFVGYVIENQVLPEWSSLYQSQYTENYKTYVTDINYEGMLDLLMQAIQADQLPDSLKSIGGSVGSCLAGRIEETSEAKGCHLDNSDAPADTPSTLELIWMKYTCFVPFITPPCNARKAIFADAKAQLIQAKKDGLMAKVFPQIFPTMFQSGLIGGANKIQADIGSFVSGKFKTQADAGLWDAPLVDLQDTKNSQTSLGEFATGLAADIRGASVLLDSHPEIAAPLLYAAANRLLTLMGGTEVSWDSKQDQFKILPSASRSPSPAASSDVPAAPAVPPVPNFATNSFGGMGFIQATSGPSAGHEIQQAWDPNQSYSPPPLKLLASFFELGANDIPAAIPSQAGAPQAITENMVDLGNLMSALVDFLELTSPSSNLASHFIDVNTDPQASSEITDGANPALFPRQGRQLAILMIASIVENMIAPNGHVVTPSGSANNGPPDEHSGLMGIRFYNEIGLGGRLEGKVPTQALASVFAAASRFSVLAAANDPDIPPKFMQLKSEIDQAIDISMLSMIGRSQQSDGGFVDNLGDPASSERSLDTQMEATRALTTVYTQTREPAQRLALRQAWTFLDHFWPNGSDLPISGLAADASPAPDAGALSAVSAWGLLNLWTQTQASPLYTDLTNPAEDQVWGKNGWDKWQARFDTLRKQLEGQLDSDQGPQPLGQ